MVDFQAFADSIETDPTRSHWPPSAVNSPNTRKKALESTGFDTTAFNLDIPSSNAGQMALPNNDQSGMPYQINNGANFTGASGFHNGFGVNSMNGFGSFGFPDVPTASFGLSVGSFMPEANMDDLMFTNDALWWVKQWHWDGPRPELWSCCWNRQSILNAPPLAVPGQGMMG